jgi:hypothetical protein
MQTIFCNFKLKKYNLNNFGYAPGGLVGEYDKIN